MIIASNFKTNHTRSTTASYVEVLNNFLEPRKITDEILVFPPSSAIDNYKIYNGAIGVQNAYPVKNGSFTGEIGLEQLEEFGINTILIGHSERRHILGESQALIAKKFQFFAEHQFKIVYCIGEPIEVRKKGIDAVMAYMQEQLEGIDLAYDQLIVAYEPVWAIGTGVTASNEEIDETLNRLREKMQVPLLYGGSVKTSNVEEIYKIKNCDGVLVGTASWDAGAFCEMIEIAKKVEEE